MAKLSRPKDKPNIDDPPSPPPPPQPPQQTSHLSLSNHPLIVEAKDFLTRRLWLQWRGGLAGSILTILVAFSFSDSTLTTLISHKCQINSFLSTFLSTLLLARANYIEHFLQPPVEPPEITRWCGKLPFFTVNVIFLTLAYFTLSTITQLIEITTDIPPILNDTLFIFFYTTYTLGCTLSIFYYLGVFTDEDERQTINKHQSKGIPLSSYLHSTHGSTIVLLQVHIIFIPKTLLTKHSPSSYFPVLLSLLTFSIYYNAIVSINYRKSGYWPYPFLNKINATKSPLTVLALLQILNFITMLLGYAAYSAINAAT